jgi:hypothetical protein
MNQQLETPTFNFFRATPPELLTNPPLASSLQSLETTFLLLSLERYPSALVTCVSAWESVIKAKLAIPPEDRRTSTAQLLEDIRKSEPILMEFDQGKLKILRDTRNHITHYGFSPHHDQDCGRLLIETGLPFLTALYQTLFGFHLHWRDVRAGLTDFTQLTAQEARTVGLIPDLSDQISIVNTMFELNRHSDGFDVLLCFKVFTHYLRFMLRESYASYTDELIAERTLSNGMRFQIEQEEKNRISNQMGGETWEFDCPICHSPYSIVAGLNTNMFDQGRVLLNWGVCVSCHLVMPQQAHHLTDLVLSKELARQEEAILAGYK